LSERVPWYEQTRQAAWSRELAEEVEAQRGRLDILEGKHKEQAPVDRRLVRNALRLAITARNYSPWTMERFSPIVALLRRALEGDSNAQD